MIPATGHYQSPDAIIPFKISRDRCKALYSEELKKVPFLPNEYKDPSFLQGFRGVYIPFYIYKVVMNGSMNFAASRHTELPGNRYKVDNFNITVNIQGDAPYERDASSLFADDMDKKITPYDKNSLKKYNANYLAGFYGDIPDVDPHIYDENAVSDTAAAAALKGEKAAETAIPGAIVKTDGLRGAVIDPKLALRPQITGMTTTACPVWFLTWKKGDRVAYSVVNGENGKMASDLPLDRGKMGLAVLGISAVIFVVLFAITHFMTFSLPMMNELLAVAVLIMLALLRSETISIAIKENHIGDEGYRGPSTKMPEKMQEKLDKKHASRLRKKAVSGMGVFALTTLWVLLFSVGSGFISAFFSVLSNSSGAGAAMAAFISFGLMIADIVLMVSTFRYSNYTEEKIIKLEAFMLFLLSFIIFAVCLLKPVSDIYYYGCGLISAVILVITGFGIIKRLNLMTLRKMPSFYDRKGGNNSGKEQ
jgi:hypothetical protein